MIINHNTSALVTQKTLKFHGWNTDKDLKRLSSGQKISKASDDASGIAISEKMRSQIRGLRQAERNVEDSMSLIQTTEAYLNEITELIQRIRVVAVQSANGIYTEQDRELMQVEISALIDEIDRVASQAQYNRMNLLTGERAILNPSASIWSHMGPNSHQRRKLFIQTMSSSALKLRNPIVLTFVSVGYPESATKTIGLADEALKIVSKQRTDLGAYYNRLEYTAKTLMSAYEDIQAPESRIRDADMAEDIVEYTKNQILAEATTSILAQANTKPQLALQLLK